MRRPILVKSIRRLTGPDSAVANAAVMWRFPGRALVTIAGSMTVVLLVLEMIDSGPWPEHLVMVGLVGVLVSSLAADVRILAEVDGELLWFRSSRIRQAAVAVLGPLRDGTVPVKQGSTVMTSEWKIGDDVYMVTKRSEKQLEALTVRHKQA